MPIIDFKGRVYIFHCPHYHFGAQVYILNYVIYSLNHHTLIFFNNHVVIQIITYMIAFKNYNDFIYN